jgi:hypothetical protein
VLLLIGAWGIAFAVAQPWPRGNNESTMPVGIIFSLVGLGVSAGTVANWYNRGKSRRRQERVWYALTDRRAIIWIPEPDSESVRIVSLPGNQIKSLERVERPDGSGSLEFTWPRVSRVLPWKPSGFEHIAEVRRVEQIVRNHFEQSVVRV